MSTFVARSRCYLKSYHQIGLWCRFGVQEVDTKSPESKINVPPLELDVQASKNHLNKTALQCFNISVVD